MYTSHCRLRRTEPRPQVTCKEIWVEFRRVVFEICERTDKQTDTLIAILRSPNGGEVKVVNKHY